MSGHLSHQVEHHLYPDLPAWRYRELGPKVQAICERYGIPYHTETMPKQMKSVAINVVKYALPPTEKLPKWLQKGISKGQPLLSKLQRNAKDTLDKPKQIIDSAVQLSFPTILQKSKKVRTNEKMASAA